MANMKLWLSKFLTEACGKNHKVQSHGGWDAQIGTLSRDI